MTDVRRLQLLEAITDSALRELDLDKLFAVLPQQVRELFAVDTAGTVATRREPVQIDHVDPSTVVNPLLWERGLRVMLGVPMVAEGELIGVLHIGSTTARRFTDEDVDLLQLTAERLATAAHIHRSRSELAAAALLQDSLLPAGRRPHPPGSSPPGTCPAWAATGTTCSTCPATASAWSSATWSAADCPPPSSWDDCAAPCAPTPWSSPTRRRCSASSTARPAHFEANTTATVAYAVIDTTTARVDLALAGHLPPVLAAPGEPSRLVH